MIFRPCHVVMDENTSKRDNRLALLRDVQILLGGVADLSRIARLTRESMQLTSRFFSPPT